MRKHSCPKCGQAKLPFRYNQCPLCQYRFSDLYISDGIKIPSDDSYDDSVAMPPYRGDLAELYD